MTALSSELRRAMTVRGMNGARLSAASGIPRTSISGYRNGKRFHHATALALAEALDWPRLVEIVVQTATKACAVCGRDFVDGGQQLRAFCCSKACYRTLRSRRMREASDSRHMHAGRRLRVFQETLAAWCRDCTAGENICRDDGCTWRDLSPLPFVPLTAVSRRKVA